MYDLPDGGGRGSADDDPDHGHDGVVLFGRESAVSRATGDGPLSETRVSQVDARSAF
jgi:hypothetical protein